MRIKITLIVAAFLMLGVASCSNEVDVASSSKTENVFNVSSLTKPEAKERFASILSQVVYQHENVREFLKNEALKEFDENHDVLYALVRDEKVGDSTFRQLLLANSSEKELSAIEQIVPLLNIYLPAVVFKDLEPQNFDTRNNEIPIAAVTDSSAILYMNGVRGGEVPRGEIPAFPLLVVNENTRVELPAPAVRGISEDEVVFKSPNYNRKRNNVTRATYDSEHLDWKILEAFRLFNEDNNSNSQMAFQREFIYYGMTPTKTKGKLNRGVREYINSIEVSPKLYFRISDDRDTQNVYVRDPYVETNYVEKLGGPGYDYTTLIDKMWKQGTYNFKFEIYTSNREQPYEVYIPAEPRDLWDFNIYHYRRHKTWFRREFNTYSINPAQFISKCYNLEKFSAMLPAWDLPNEGFIRYVNIFEEDVAETKEYTDEYTFETVDKSNFKGGLKLGLGFGGDANSSDNGVSFGGDNSSETTRRITKRVHVSRTEGSDALGKIRISYFDPIVRRAVNGQYELNEYSTGGLLFTIIAK